MLNERYALLGTYQEPTGRKNVEIIATSNDRDELIDIWNAIETVNKKLQDTGRELYPEMNELINKRLPEVDIIVHDSSEVYVAEIKVIDIIEMRRFIKKTCVKCNKLLFVGSEDDARRLVIYCQDC